MWESSDFLILTRTRKVLPPPSIKLGLALTVLNFVLWLVAFILQAILLSKIQYEDVPTPYTLAGICLGWSVVIFLVTAGSLIGLFRNTLKDIKSYLVLTGSTAVFSFFIFVINVIILSLDTTTSEDWLEPAGFSIFTGLYVFGENCLVIWYFAKQWKDFKQQVEDERMDRIQQRMREQQHHHLSVLTNVSQSAPSIEYDVQHVTEVAAEKVEIEIENEDYTSDVDSVDSDRLTYYPPVFV